MRAFLLLSLAVLASIGAGVGIEAPFAGGPASPGPVRAVLAPPSPGSTAPAPPAPGTSVAPVPVPARTTSASLAEAGAAAAGAIAALRPPRGARPVAAPSYRLPVGEAPSPWIAEVRRTWRLAASPGEIGALVGPDGRVDTSRCASGSGSGPGYDLRELTCPILGEVGQLVVAVLSGGAGAPVELAAQASVFFGPGRPAGEHVSLGFSRLESGVVDPAGHVVGHLAPVGNASFSRRLARSLDGLHTASPASVCNLEVGPASRFGVLVFVPAGTRHAPVLRAVLGPCGTIAVRVGSRHEPALQETATFAHLVAGLASVAGRPAGTAPASPATGPVRAG